VALPLTADSCGTGGDGSATVNISTAVAVVAAEAGLPMVKHGNRSISSKCGSADVLEACGVKIDVSPELAARCLQEERICFLFAPRYHAAMQHAMPVRRALRTRTIFNLLGPLSNPAAPPVQLLGVYDPALCRPMAETLRLLGCTRALVVHGAGLDEIALHGPTQGALLLAGTITDITISPEDAGLHEHPLEALAGGDPQENAAWLLRLLAGEATSAHNEAVAINAGALLWIAGKAKDLAAGAAQALAVIAAGKAKERLVRWGELSHGRA
jgi:anthranilate phosphoribosyltransferase